MLTKQIDWQSVIQLAVLFIGLAFGYGLLNGRVNACERDVGDTKRDIGIIKQQVYEIHGMVKGIEGKLQ